MLNWVSSCSPGGTCAEIFPQTWQPSTLGAVIWPSADDAVGYRLRPPKLTPVSLISMVEAQCDKLRGQARRSNVDRRKYCQLGSTDESRQFITL